MFKDRDLSMGSLIACSLISFAGGRVFAMQATAEHMVFYVLSALISVAVILQLIGGEDAYRKVALDGRDRGGFLTSSISKAVLSNKGVFFFSYFFLFFSFPFSLSVLVTALPFLKWTFAVNPMGVGLYELADLVVWMVLASTLVSAMYSIMRNCLPQLFSLKGRK